MEIPPRRGVRNTQSAGELRLQRPDAEMVHLQSTIVDGFAKHFNESVAFSHA
jgi:hypothetical protein